VLVIAKHCAGAVILGFEHCHVTAGCWKRGTTEEREVVDPIAFPTPWNQLEAGILFGLQLPLLVFRQPPVSGGIFDNGVTDVFIHQMPTDGMSQGNKTALAEVFRKWQARVRDRYYHETWT